MLHDKKAAADFIPGYADEGGFIMELLKTKKELTEALKNITYKDIKSGHITITIYTKPSASSVLYDVNGSIYLKDSDEGIYFFKEADRIGGYGYDRWSTALSEGLNNFKSIYRIKTTLRKKTVNKLTGFKEFYTRKDRRVYGLYENGSISYGIGVSAVLDCVKEGFSNLKLTSAYYGKNEDRFTFEIKEAR